MTVNYQHLTASELLRIKPKAECCDCSLEATDANEESVWTIWHNGHVYCPKCAKYENIGPEA